MGMTTTETLCVCGTVIQQAHPGHRPRKYCSPRCKQRAYRLEHPEKRRRQLRQQWSSFPEAAQRCLETLMLRYDEDAAQLALSLLKIMQ